jgi:hypothetical protein
VRSASRHPSARLGLVSLCLLLVAGAAGGCSTTQEKAEKHQAQAEHILDARAVRQKQKKNDNQHGKSTQMKDANGGSGQ